MLNSSTALLSPPLPTKKVLEEQSISKVPTDLSNNLLCVIGTRPETKTSNCIPHHNEWQKDIYAYSGYS